MTKISKTLICFLLVLQFACNNTKTNSKAKVLEAIKIENQGVAIDYEDSKIGDTTLVFIHGWCIDKSYWANQTPYFTKKYRVVTLDLPGFGKSGKNRKTWTVEDYGKDMSALLTKLDLKNVILVGHSMSGAIALETALTNPSRVMGVVGIDNFKDIGLVITPKMAKEWAGFYNAMRQNFEKSVSENMSQYLFAPSTDSTVRKRVLTDILKTDKTLAVDCLEDNDKYPLAEKLKLLKKPLYLINSDVMPTDTTVFQKNKIDYHLFNIGSIGHYPMLEKPNEFNVLLGQAIEMMGK